MLSLLIILGPEREKGLLKKGQRLTKGKAFAVDIYFYLRVRGADRQTGRCVYCVQTSMETWRGRWVP